MAEKKQLLDAYVEAVLRAPNSLHLTATREPGDFLQRHVLDALRLIERLPPDLQKRPSKVLDLGSGNGIPGIPAAICAPHWTLELIDSDSKKCGFLDMFCKNIGLKNARVTHGRAETLAHSNRRESFDLVFARALGKLPTALELAGAFVKVGNLLIVPHGTSWNTEMARSKTAMLEIGLTLRDARPYQLTPGTKFVSLEFEKVSPTPQKYPRAVGIPTKRPL